MFIRLRGGARAAMNSAFAYGPLADYFDLPDATRTLSRSAYYNNDQKTGRAWDNEVKLAAKALKDDGYLVSTTRSGELIWHLTASGSARADFWLVRMTEKTNALKALAVDDQLAYVDTDDRLKELESK
jgi:hypothetical protein